MFSVSRHEFISQGAAFSAYQRKSRKGFQHPSGRGCPPQLQELPVLGKNWGKPSTKWTRLSKLYPQGPSPPEGAGGGGGALTLASTRFKEMSFPVTQGFRKISMSRNEVLTYPHQRRPGQPSFRHWSHQRQQPLGTKVALSTHPRQLRMLL